MNRIYFFLLVLSLSGCNANSGELADTFQLDDLQFKNITHTRSSKHCQQQSTDDTCATITIYAPKFVKTPKHTTPKELNYYITKHHIAYHRNNASPAIGIPAYIQSYLKEYDEFIKENKQLSGAWQLNKNIQVIAYKNSILSLKATENGYNGGAHGFSITKFASYNIEQNTPITLDSVFYPNYQETLNRAGEKAFRTVRNIPSDQSLQKSGFEFENDQFQLNNNFAVTDQGLIFFFNSYEIASYVAGSTELLIPYHEIKPLIPQNSLLATYLD